MLESEIEAYLVERVKALGGEVRKVKWIGRRGAPDRLVLLSWMDYPVVEGSDDPFAQSRPPRSIWVELKAPGEKAKPHQLREHERLRKLGQQVEIIDSKEGVDALLS